MWKLAYFCILFVVAKTASAQGCSDELPTYICSSLKKQNSCHKVRQTCQKTCGFCEEGGPTTTIRTTTERTVPASTAQVCRDHVAQCQGLAEQGSCRDHANVRRSCPLSCGECGEGRVSSAPPGRWGDWGKFGKCSVTCGSGTRRRSRKCIGKNCKGPSTSTRKCSAGRCRGKWSRWGEYGACSATCGGGRQTRNRSCTSGMICGGEATSSRECNTQSCMGKWSKWSKYGSCSVKCGGGTRTKTRVCVSGALCDGDATSSKSCNKKACKQKSGKWSRWGKYSECTKTCGGGERTKTRTCLGETACKGESSKTRGCNEEQCEGKWGPWSQVGKCSASCGGGTLTFTRRCIKGPCVGDISKKEDCNKEKCGGVWGRWSKPSPCTRSCGTGTTTKTRTCRGVCAGVASITEKCNTAKCPSWSPCTKSCGTGTRYRFDSVRCNNAKNARCMRTFEECNTSPCPDVICNSLNAQEFRYGMENACCNKTILAPRIFQGKKADIRQWPWMVLVQSASGVICGGTLIHEQWVLTAAHCVTGPGNTVNTDISVYAAIRTLSERKLETKHAVESIVRYPDYENLVHDLALIKLRNQIKRTDKSLPVKLPRSEETPTDTTCFATGWGLTNPNPIVERPSEPLMQVDLQILDIGVCRKAYLGDPEIGSYLMNNDKLLCAGSLSKRNDVCKGDSGGPLMCQRCSSCEWYVAGITSFGPVGTCGKIGYPGMYTKVEAFESWITQNIPELQGKDREICPYKYGP